jgi:hypothetical protein
VRRRGPVWLWAAGSAAAFVVAFYLRLDAAYGPFNLSWRAGDWTVLWELLRHGQIAPAIVAESLALGAAAAAVPWAIIGLWALWALRARRRGTR